MTINSKFSFECAVQSLARVLARLKPTPWEKVSAQYQSVCPSARQIDNRFPQFNEKKNRTKIIEFLEMQRKKL